jgi:hypothetical protein
MAPKKKKKAANSKPKKAVKKKVAPKKKAPAKKAAPSKLSLKKAPPKPKNATPKKKASPKTRPTRGSSLESSRAKILVKRPASSSAGQSGDLQGLSNSARVDSESVDELLEEGNAFEAEVIDGVENAPDADQGEVRTHEVPEADVPEEYLDKDK